MFTKYCVGICGASALAYSLAYFKWESLHDQFDGCLKSSEGSVRYILCLFDYKEDIAFWDSTRRVAFITAVVYGSLAFAGQWVGPKIDQECKEFANRIKKAFNEAGCFRKSNENRVNDALGIRRLQESNSNSSQTSSQPAKSSIKIANRAQFRNKNISQSVAPSAPPTKPTGSVSKSHGENYSSSSGSPLEAEWAKIRRRALTVTTN